MSCNVHEGEVSDSEEIKLALCCHSDFGLRGEKNSFSNIQRLCEMVTTIRRIDLVRDISFVLAIILSLLVESLVVVVLHSVDLANHGLVGNWRGFEEDLDLLNSKLLNCL